jgi:uncharacterized protein (DUF1778 family)
MSRISIDITPEAHQRLKAFAALKGQTIKDYILECALPPLTDITTTEAAALLQLQQFLKPRLDAARRGEFSPHDFDGIIAQVRTESTAL